MDKKTTQKVINNMAEKIEALHKSVVIMKEMQEITKNKCDVLETSIKELEQKANRTGQFHLDAINEKFNKLEKQINNIFELLKSGNIAFIKDIPDINQETDITNKLNDRCDDLEAKNFQIKSDLDKLINNNEGGNNE